MKTMKLEDLTSEEMIKTGRGCMRFAKYDAPYYARNEYYATGSLLIIAGIMLQAYEDKKEIK